MRSRGDEEGWSHASSSSVLPPSPRATDFLFCLEASDCFLKQRVMNLPQSAVQGTSYTYDRFPQRLARYRENQALDGTALHYFNDLDILPHHIGVWVWVWVCVFVGGLLFIHYLRLKVIGH